MPNIPGWNINYFDDFDSIYQYRCGISMAMLERPKGFFNLFLFFTLLLIIFEISFYHHVEIGVGTDYVNVSRTTLTYPTIIG